MKNAHTELNRVGALRQKRYIRLQRDTKPGDRKGFTIIELMIVLFILLTLAGLTVVGTREYMNRARKARAKLFIESMKTPLEAYLLDHGKYPEANHGLDALVNATEDVDISKGNWPYITKSAIQLDPWNQAYNYQYPGTNDPGSYDLWSSGPDQVAGTEDDIW